MKVGDWFYWQSTCTTREMVAHMDKISSETYTYTAHYHNKEKCPYKIVMNIKTFDIKTIRVLTPREIAKFKLEQL